MITPHSDMTIFELACSIQRGLAQLAELERDFAKEFNLPLPVSVPTEVGCCGVPHCKPAESSGQAREGTKLVGPLENSSGQLPTTLAAGNTLPVRSGVNEVGCSAKPASAGESSLAASTLPTFSALRTVSLLNARLDPTPVELQDMLSQINQSE